MALGDSAVLRGRQHEGGLPGKVEAAAAVDFTCHLPASRIKGRATGGAGCARKEGEGMSRPNRNRQTAHVGVIQHLELKKPWSRPSQIQMLPRLKGRESGPTKATSRIKRGRTAAVWRQTRRG